MVPWRTGGRPVLLLCSTKGQEDAPGWAQPVPARLPHRVPQPRRLPGASLAPCPCHGADSSLWGPKPSARVAGRGALRGQCGSRRPHPRAAADATQGAGCPGSEQEAGAAGGGGARGAGRGLQGSSRRGAGASGCPGPTMHALGQLLLVLVVGLTGGRGDPRDTLACSQVGWCHQRAGIGRLAPLPASPLPLPGPHLPPLG